jgi:hypothetical protein
MNNLERAKEALSYCAAKDKNGRGRLFDEGRLAEIMVQFALEHCNAEVERRRLAEARLEVSQSVNVAAAIQDEVTAAGMATAEAYRKWVYETDPTGANPRDAVEAYRQALEAAGRKQP